MDKTGMTTRTWKPLATVGADAVLLALACLIPAASHALALPLYKLNPMLALMLAGMVAGKDWRNGLLLAVLLPAVSWLAVGMPTAAKAVCMAAELATVAAVFGGLQRKWSPMTAVLAAAVAGKGVYYLLKALLLPTAPLVGTEWWLQAGAVVLWGGLFALIYRRPR